MICKKCNTELLANVKIGITIPSSKMFEITKAEIRKKDVKLLYVERAFDNKFDLFCPKCGWVSG